MENIFKTFNKALKKKFIIGAFNFYNLETLQAILEAGEQCKVPVICSASESAISYMGIETTVNMFKSLVKGKKFPAYLHLDHGSSYESCKKAIDKGFNSVMIDTSSLPFKENVKLTQKVVAYAKKKGVFVEGELGSLAGIEEDLRVEELDARFTDPKEAKEFIKLTGVNSLAIAIGTSHGAYKFKGEPKLRLDILEEIEKEIGKFPLVLHGASTVDQKLTDNINQFGGDIKNAKGVSVSDLKKISKNHNVCKINVDTDLRLAFISATREHLSKNPNETNPRSFLLKSKEKMIEVISLKIRSIFRN